MHERARRVATLEWERQDASSVADATRGDGDDNPWAEAHGYHRMVATRPATNSKWTYGKLGEIIAGESAVTSASYALQSVSVISMRTQGSAPIDW